MTTTRKLIIDLRTKAGGLPWSKVVQVAVKVAKINRELAEKIVKEVRGF